MEAAGIEPVRSNRQRLSVQELSNRSEAQSAHSQQSRGSDCPNISPHDDALRRVIDAWPKLSAHIKTVIQTLCQPPRNITLAALYDEFQLAFSASLVQPTRDDITPIELFCGSLRDWDMPLIAVTLALMR